MAALAGPPSSSVAPLTGVKRAAEDARQACWRAQAALTAAADSAAASTAGAAAAQQQQGAAAAASAQSVDASATLAVAIARVSAAAADLGHLRTAANANHEIIKHYVAVPAMLPPRDPHDSTHSSSLLLWNASFS